VEDDVRAEQEEVRAAEVIIERRDDGIDITMRRPRKPAVVIYELLMWAPLAGFVGFAAWMLLFNDRLAIDRMLVVAVVGVVPAAVLYAVFGMITVPGWSPVQRVRVCGHTLRKQYPIWRLDSAGLPVQLDLSGYRTCEAVVERVKRDSKRANHRPAFRDRICLMCNGRRMLFFGPSLTTTEAQLVADSLNAYLAERAEKARRAALIENV
jgi:hypothetical protein